MNILRIWYSAYYKKDLSKSHSEFFPCSLMLHLTELGDQTQRPVISLCKLKNSPLPGSPWSALKYLHTLELYRGKCHWAWFWAPTANFYKGWLSSSFPLTCSYQTPSFCSYGQSNTKTTTTIENSYTPLPLRVNYLSTWGQMIQPTKHTRSYA